MTIHSSPDSDTLLFSHSACPMDLFNHTVFKTTWTNHLSFSDGTELASGFGGVVASNDYT